MQRQGTEFRRRYEHTPVTLDHILEIQRAVESRLHAKLAELELRPKEPAGFDDLFGPSWSNFCAVWQRHPTEIRKFNVVFASGKMTCRADSVCVDLFVRNQGHHGEASVKEIALFGFNITEGDFKTFCSICENILGLVRAPASGFDLPHARLLEKYELAITHTSLRAVVHGALAHKDYDGAIRSALVLVEDELRKQCLANGGSAAAGQTGADLAATAYHPAQGCMNPPWPIATSANEGAHLMFRGVVMYLRNAWGHNTTVMGSDESGVFDCLATCQFLLTVIARSTKR
jgi:hypothetical protein